MANEFLYTTLRETRHSRSSLQQQPPSQKPTTPLLPGFLHYCQSCPFRSIGTYLGPSDLHNYNSSQPPPYKKIFFKKTIPKYYLNGKRENKKRTGREEAAAGEGWSPEETAVSTTR